MANNAPPPPRPPRPPRAGNNPDDVTGIERNRLMAALSYVGVLVLVPLFTERDDPFVRFHVKQGLVVLAGEVLAVLAGWWFVIIANLLWLLMLIASVLGLVQALQGRRWKIPGIWQIADKFRI